MFVVKSQGLFQKPFVFWSREEIPDPAFCTGQSQKDHSSFYRLGFMTAWNDALLPRKAR